MTTLERLTKRKRARGEPPERFHAFVSYTTREDEVRIVKPLVDHFLNAVLRPAIEQALGEPPFFYDGYSLYYPSGSRLSNPELETTLRFAIEESEVLIAFVSPEYPASNWCMFECRTMASKELRPWFDLCRIPPIPELRDQRPPDLRPHWWECVRTRFLMWRVARASETWRRLSGRALKGRVSPSTEMRVRRTPVIRLDVVPVRSRRACASRASSLSSWVGLAKLGIDRTGVRR